MKEEKTMASAVVVFFLINDKVLLGEKGRGIGKGFLNSYGGEIDPGETPPFAAVREIGEESGGATIIEERLEKIAICDFQTIKSDGSRFVCTVHMYKTREWMGGPKSTPDILNPDWYFIRSLPIERLMLADRIWLPIALSGEKMYVKATYGPHQQSLIGDVIMEKVKSFPEE